MAAIQEYFTPVRLTATATVIKGAGVFGGLFCTTAGTVTIQDSSNTDIVSSFAVAVGNYYPIPMAVSNGCQVVIAGGAVCTVFVA